ncbi:MAG TPA: hypothetical protein DGL25_02725, partial [Dehalococcoidia bacterium]|nr:hypothetical protein [Dehalococcoidia bacterium]
MTRLWLQLRHTYYGWWLLIGSVFAVALIAGTSFWSIGLYVDPLESEFGWSRWQVSGGFSIAQLMSGLAAPLIGFGTDRYGPRRMILVGTVLTAASYMLMATISELWQWYAYQS